MTSRTLLIDTDILAYKCSAISQTETAFGTALDFTKACKEADQTLTELLVTLKADSLIVCLTDKENWRLNVLPTYKANRAGIKRPELLADLKAYLADEWDSYIRPTLEADDVMGILATHSKLIPGEKIIVSEDKDMRTIPAKVYAPHRQEVGLIEISRLDADRFHMWQTICGDPVDGYGGAKGVGKSSVYAEEIIGADSEELWDIVLDAYASVGLTEEDALQQARVARILRAEDYDFKTKEVKLWQPEMLMV